MPRVLVMPIDDAGCGNYRLRFPAGILSAEGYDVTVDAMGPGAYWDRTYTRVIGLSDIKGADIFVTQRPTNICTYDTIRHLLSIGVKVVVDVDDRLDRVHRTHAGYNGFNGLYESHEILDDCCKIADLVTCTTPALLDRYGYGHGVVLPNLIPAKYLDLWAMPRPNTLGWSGFVGTHPGDLEMTGTAIQQAIDRNRPAGVLAGSPWTVHIVGTGENVRQAARLRDEPSVSGVVPFDLYPQTLGEISVGMVPLVASEFNAAKSCLKMMEFAAVGVPVVASPTPDNVRLHRLGVGLLAPSRRKWVEQLSRLMGSSGYRDELAGSGRQAVAGLTYEQHADRWWQAWMSTIKEKVPA